MSRRPRFDAPCRLRGFTPIPPRELQLLGLLSLDVSETHRRFALLPFGPSSCPDVSIEPLATMASADTSLRVILVVLSDPTRGLPR